MCDGAYSAERVLGRVALGRCAQDEHGVREASACVSLGRVLSCRGAQDQHGVSEASACGSLCGGWAGWD